MPRHNFGHLNHFFFFVALLYLSSSSSAVDTDAFVTSIEPTEGSLAGGTMVYIHGDHFSESQFSQFGNPLLGNRPFFKSLLHSTQCDVLTTDVSTKRIACETRASPTGLDGDYELHITVDGKLVTSYCGGSKCIYKFRAGSTPTITHLQPRTSVPGIPTTLCGKIYTTQVSRLPHSSSEEFNPVGKEITRIYFGASTSDPFDAAINEQFESFIDSSNNGCFKSKPQSLLPASNDVFYLVSKMGRSLVDKNLIQVDGMQNLYVQQTHAGVKFVSPTSGSLAGGTVLTITGEGFGNSNKHVEVHVGGIPCTILSVSGTQIQCRTDAQTTPKSIYQGSRGLLREIWVNTTKSNLNDIAALTSSAPDYFREILTNGSSPEVTSFPKYLSYSSRVSGFFVAPWDDSYRFHIRSDDKSELFLSSTGDPAQKIKVASCPYATSKWDKYDSQTSAAVNLKKDQEVYLVAHHLDTGGSGHHVGVAVSMDNVKHPSIKTGGAVDETQTITTASDVRSEKQILDFSKWNVSESVQGEQEVRVPRCVPQVNVTACDSNAIKKFQLVYEGHTTANLSQNCNAQCLEQALNGLPSVRSRGNVTVTSIINSDYTTYKVKFLKSGSVEMLTALFGGERGVNVTRVRYGGSARNGTKLKYGGIISDTFMPTVSKSDFTNILTNMFSVVCQSTVEPGRSSWFDQGYETPKMGTEFGERVSDEMPFCGRTSLKNPSYVYRIGYTKKKNGGNVIAYDINRNPHLCFAYKGPFRQYIQIKVLYTRNSGDTRTEYPWYSFERGTVSQQWRHICVDLKKKIEVDARFNDAEWKSKYQVEWIKVMREPETSADMFFDNLWIGKVSTEVTPIRQPAQPNGHLINSFEVEKLSPDMFEVRLEPAKCGMGLPLFAIGGSDTVSSGNPNKATYHVTGLQSHVTVQRNQSSSPPITGTFTVTCQGTVVTGIPADASAAQLKQFLEESCDVDVLDVTRTGSCSSYIWQITWSTKGGNHPQLNVTSNLTGIQAFVSSKTLTDGRYFMHPISSEFLRVPSDKPQVVVKAYDIIGSCNDGKCTFEYHSSQTPQLHSITPTSGTGGTEITVSGSGFSTICSENKVLIEGTTCNITACTETTLTCTVGSSAGGTRKVSAVVSNKGNAATNTSSARRKRRQAPAVGAAFTFSVTIASVTPIRGSTAGGIVLNIDGDGFGSSLSSVTVTLGGSGCDVISLNNSHITCRATAHAAGQVACTINVDSSSKTNVNAFEYDAALTPAVSTISPLTGAVGGTNTMTISGSGFGTSNNVVVKIGDNTCVTQTVTDTQIQCTIPKHGPARLTITIDIPGKGYCSIPSAHASYNYILRIDSISPLIGSVAGGTMVTITGSGFSSDLVGNTITVGGKPCKVTYSASNGSLVTCRTPDNFKTVQIDNSGRHDVYGAGYAWSKRKAEINQGDSVQWKWAAQYLSESQYQVQQTASEQASAYDGMGFKSSRSGTGSFKHRFLSPGMFYYSSGAVDLKAEVFMNGKVSVSGFRSQDLHIKFTVEGFDAVCNATPQQAASSTSCDTGVTTSISNCEVTQPNPSIPGSDHCLSFAYRKCHTPVVSQVTPNNGTSNDIITVQGTGFSVTQCQIEVTFGGHACDVISSSETQITCRLNTATKPSAGTKHEVAVNVKNRGNAFVQPKSGGTTYFILVPSVTSVTSNTGSQGGGSQITITGNGFSPSRTLNTVKIGTAVCRVKTSTYSSLVCTTGSQPSGATDPLDVTNTVGVATSSCSNVNCRFTYSSSKTPRVTEVLSNQVSSPNHILRIYGSGFGSNPSSVTVTVGDTACAVTMASNGAIKCNIPGLLVGNHAIKVTIIDKGDAVFDAASASSVTSNAAITSLSPKDSSVNGGLRVTVTGNGFKDGVTSVTIGGKSSQVISVTLSELVVETPPYTCQSVCTVDFVVSVDGTNFPTKELNYVTSVTPVVNSISPSSTAGGQAVTISGVFPGGSTATAQVRIGEWFGPVSSASPQQIICTVPSKPAGTYPLSVVIQGKGKATSSSSLTIQLGLTSASPAQSGYGGGRTLVVNGNGFSSSTVVKVCNNICVHSQGINVTNTHISCEVPKRNRGASGVDHACPVEVVAGGMSMSLSNAFTYRHAMTSEIISLSPRRSGTGGGVVLTITGTGFSTVQSENNVFIDGTRCDITSATSTQIQCTTGAHGRTIKSKVRVDVSNNGKALDDNGDLDYVDVWSSKYSWGGNNPPGEGSYVVIKKGQTMMIDTDTAILKMLLIKGGKVMFDDKDIHLQSEYILILEGGVFEVGTESQPCQHNATITLHGHVLSKEIPVYGSKMIALREGTLDLHGKHVTHTWTRLSQTAEAGTNQLHLQKNVTWKPGDEIVIAATGRSQRENEELFITNVLNDGFTLEVTPPLKYKHISIVQTFVGRQIETRAEVGLLSRNVVVQGSKHEDWKGKIEACPEEFKPGQFKTQTCFQGRFGEEVISDQFGVQIMIHAPVKDKGLVTARFSHIEIRHAGQAFRLGRYPIHFHVSGSVKGSYVRGCAIHHSFNRAITMHGIHHLVVERNVIYDVMGNAYFMEDGIETGNVVQYNLGIFVISSSSALNVDITPATYWVTNANNTVSHNAAAGGSHFGFWYQMFERPDGPSFDPNYCPRNVPMKVFTNNSAHSFGRYGLWIFPVYHPMKGGSCGSNIVEPAVFDGLTSWCNMRGAEAVKVGAVRITNATILDNDIAGIEYVFADTEDNPWGGAMISDSLIIGHSALSGQNSQKHCTKAGIRTPQTHRLLISNVTFVNFNDQGCSCTALKACAQCKGFHKRGGFETRMEKLRFVDSHCRATFQWKYETIFRDLDGTLTGITGGGTALPTNNLLPPGKCSPSPLFSYGQAGSVCDNTLSFRRFALNRAKPASLVGKDVRFTNQYGNDTVPFNAKDKTHPMGWMVTLLMYQDYELAFIHAEHITNITYHGTLFEPRDCEYARITHQLMQKPDHFSTTGKFQNMTEVTPAADSPHGTWCFRNDTKTFQYILSGCKNRRSANRNLKDKNVRPQVYRCFYDNCITPTPPPPPKGRPAQWHRWWEPEDWETMEVPWSESDVTITSDMWMVVDKSPNPIGKLFVEGVLEVDSLEDVVINASYILITGGFIVGWPDKPYPRNVLISLRGGWSSEDVPIGGGPNTGSKSLSVFGYMFLHAMPKNVYWTQISTTAAAGANTVTVKEAVDWNAGDEIVIASTTVEPEQTETFRITAVSGDRRTLTLNGTLQYTHKAVTSTANQWFYTMAAEVGLLTRNIVIAGADEPVGSLGQQSFGSRVLIGSYGRYVGSARIENVEFRHCGQEGWTDWHDPRYCLAFLDVGDVEGNTSFVRGNSFHHCYNTGIGVSGTNNLIVEHNVVHHTVGPSIRLAGKYNTLYNNLAVFSISIQTYKTRQDRVAVHWPGAIETHEGELHTLIGNTVAGSERIGFMTDGEPCTADGVARNWRDNEVHGAWHGIHIRYLEGIKGCSKLAHFFTWGNLDYGAFLFPESSIIVDNVISADNPNGFLPNIWGPRAVDHKTENKLFKLINSLFVGTSPGYTCGDASILPRARVPYQDFGAKMTPDGGRVGITMTYFCSVKAKGPGMPWESPKSYQAINGNTVYKNVTFANFGVSCGKRDIAIMANPWIGDIIHPMDVSEIKKHLVDTESAVHYVRPNLKWVNPSDCVDMDCDARRQLLIRDLDGSLTGSNTKITLVSKAEYQWSGDVRFGLDDYRIPKTALTAPDGSKLSVTTVYPNRGINRGTKTQTSCSWNTPWNAYKCTNLDHMMLVVESMDKDTETRRLSPVALGSDGYMNLVNGPMDHGWCLGYTCQERLSIFHSIVVTNKHYDVFFTSTEPQHLRFHLLNSDYSQVLRIGVFFMKPQRKDVYRKGVFINPTNAELSGSSFTLKEKPAAEPDDYFMPKFSDTVSGLNYFDRDASKLYFIVRGSEPVEIRTMPVIQVTLNVKAVSVDDFFKANLINNLADLLGVDRSLIRCMDVVSASPSRRRRRATSSDQTSLVIEISNPPAPTVPYSSDTNATVSNSTTNPTPPANYTGSGNTTSFNELQSLTTKTVEVVQSGALAEQSGVVITGLSITDPTDSPIDPTGGVRATNVTGGSANVTNGTLTYAQRMAQAVTNQTAVINYLIPCKLVLVQQPLRANETVTFSSQPRLQIMDCNDKPVTSLGHGTLGNWTVTASIRNGTGHDNGTLNGTVTITFENGWANFTDLSISHNGTNYVLDFTISKPDTARFNASSSSFEVKERELYYSLVVQPSNANETVPFGTQPAVEVRDAANGEIVQNTGWKGREWLLIVQISDKTANSGNLNGTITVQFISGVARFTDLSIDHSGTGYQLNVTAKTVPESRYRYFKQSDLFNVKERILYLRLVQQPGNCNDTVICGSQPNVEIRNSFPDSAVNNIGWRNRKWFINATQLQGANSSPMNGTSLLRVPTSGTMTWQDISFYDVSSGHRLKFTVETEPVSSYSGLTVTSDVFDVTSRQFYLVVIRQPANANQTVPFGDQPAVEVRDVGTRMRGTPLKEAWYISGVLLSQGLNGTLSGTSVNVTVVEGRAYFTNLSVSIYGTGYVLEFQASYGQKVRSAPFEVRYVNDFSPVFNPPNGSYVASLSEDTAQGTYVTTVVATDKDTGPQGEVYFSIVGGNTNNKFVINKTSGVITTAGPLDRETTAVFNLVIRAYDGAAAGKERATNGQVVVQIGDVNDNPPVFTLQVIEATVKETANNSDVITRIQSTDADAGTNSELRYTIETGNDGGLFQIDPLTGDLKVNASLDLEQISPPELNHSIIVRATDLGTPIALNATVRVNISITAVNEFTPQLLHEDSFNFSYVENVSPGGGVYVVDVNATDNDYGNQGRVTYIFYSGNEGNKFSLDSTTGILMLVDTLDFETVPNYTLVIHSRDSDSEGNVKFALFTVYVTVIDVNDNTPTFSQPQYTRNVPENSAPGSTSFTFSADDPDGGVNGLVTYSILSTNHSQFWILNTSSGALTLNASLDMDATCIQEMTHTFEVQAQDAGIPFSLQSNTTLVLQITKVNEFLPVFPSSDVTKVILEDVTIGTVIYQSQATDADCGSDGEIQYSITAGNTGRAFAIDSTSGNITSDTSLDRETLGTYTLTITATDRAAAGQTRTTKMYLLISLGDVNDNKPTFTRLSYHVTVRENATINSLVADVQASDRDFGANGQLDYSITEGNELGFFSIEPNRGIIRVLKSLDLETQNHTADHRYSLRVFATDQGNPALNNSVIVIIGLLGVNEYAPSILHDVTLVVQISENASIGSYVCNINATDVDYGPDGHVIYTITSGIPNNEFIINSTTGVITLARKLDFETKRSHQLQVTVSDLAITPSARRTSVVHVKINVLDVNDTSPYQAEARMLQPRITPAADLASWAGIPARSGLEIIIVLQNGTRLDITRETSRFTFDTSESNNLFTLETINGVPTVVGNTGGQTGQGKLIVHITNINTIKINVTVVAFRSLNLKSVPYPESPGASEITELKQVSPGKYRPILLKAMMTLSDGFQVDVSTAINTSISVLNAADVSNAFVFGSTPANLFSFTSSGYNGLLMFRTVFGSQSSGLNLTVSSQLTTVASIVKFGYQDMNGTLKGLAGRTVSPFAQLRMDDGSTILVDNFTHYSGLLLFTSSNSAAAHVDSTSGLLTLVAHDSNMVVILAASSRNSSVTASVSFYSNPEPSIGDIDIGSMDGPAIPALTAGQTWDLPVRVNPGSTGLLAIDAQIRFDTSALQFISVVTSLQYAVDGDTISLFSPLKDSNMMSTTIASVSFRVLTTGTPSITLQSYRTVDKSLTVKPAKSTRSCNSIVYGDANTDCDLDIIDVAFIKCYVFSAQAGFTDTLGSVMRSRTTSQRSSMDVDWNTRIEDHDAVFLAEIVLGRAKFMTEMSLLIPDHNRKDSDTCSLEFKVKLVNKDGSPVKPSELEVFYDIFYSSATVHTQVHDTTLSTGSTAALKDNSTFFGGIFKSVFDTSTSTYKIASSDSKLQANSIGISVIQVVSLRGQKYVTPMYSGATPGARTLDVTLGSSVNLKLPSGYSPQRMINMAESTSRCNDPNLIQRVDIIFVGDYELTVEGKEETFKEAVVIILRKLHPEADFLVVHLRKGSILVGINVTVPTSQKDSTLAALYANIIKGISVTHNGQEVVTKPYMIVNGKEYSGKSPVEEETGLTTSYLIIIITVVFGVVVLVIIVVFYVLRKKKKINPSRPTSPENDVTRDQIWETFPMEQGAEKYMVENRKSELSVRSNASLSASSSSRVNAFCEDTSREASVLEVKDADNDSIEAMEAANSTTVSCNDMTPRLLKAFTAKPISVRSTPIPPPSVTSPSPVTEEEECEVPSEGSQQSEGNLLVAPAFELIYSLINSRSTTPVQVALPHQVNHDEVEEEPVQLKETFSSLVLQVLEAGNVGAAPSQDSTASARRTLHRKMPVNILRPNVELGTLAHFAGVVNANLLGSLEELRRDIQVTLSRSIGSKRFVFVNTKLRIIDPWREKILLVKNFVKESIRIKVLYGTERCEEFCPCGGVAEIWCESCEIQGYCTEACREDDEIIHATRCMLAKHKQREAMAVDILQRGK